MAGESAGCDDDDGDDAVVKRETAARISITTLISPLISTLSVGMRRRRSGGVWRGGMVERSSSGLKRRRKRVSAAVWGSSLVDMTSIRCCRRTPNPHMTNNNLMRMAMVRKYPLLDTMTFKSLEDEIKRFQKTLARIPCCIDVNIYILHCLLQILHSRLLFHHNSRHLVAKQSTSTSAPRAAQTPHPK